MAAGTDTELNAAFPPPRDAPGPVYGGPGPDKFIRGLTVFADSYIGLLTKLRVARGRTQPRQPGPAVPHWRAMVVADRGQECDEVVSLRLAAPGGGTLKRWHPGAHVQVELPSGKIRHYSLNGDPADRLTYRIAVRRLTSGGGGSAEIHDVLVPGTELRVAGPFNAFPFAAEPSVLFIAGGIGITPILPMAQKAAALGLDWRLVYTGRSRATMPFLAEVGSLDRTGRLDRTGHLDRTGRLDRTGQFHGAGPEERTARRVEILTDEETGRPDPAELIGRAPAAAVVYACGPPSLLAGVRGAANAAVSAGTLRGLAYERFTAPPIVDGRPFEVELSRSGTVLPVAADQSLLSVLRARDPATPYSCQQGFCGTCRQRVLSGEVDHRDLRLGGGEHAASDMLVCVSRAPEGERLVLDL
ncbi:MAG TPA: PDR/VanB family oxidoreductase [Trebonia sp.]|jgi:ferredoxin-NADP reductase|nr:PDR/VanB family oxidoreductase [Trebonia sp.]